MYIVKKKVKGKEYYYLNKAVRENGKVKSKNVAYLGKDKQEAEKKAKEITEKTQNQEKNKGNMEKKKKNNPTTSALFPQAIKHTERELLLHIPRRAH
jgi:hypothetical protein